MNLDLNQLVFWAVVLARVLVPLTIPRYPLPGIIAALIIDAVDQTIFQALTGVTFAGYQSYDKALDIYYLAIAYIATLRNWANSSALRVSHLLFYYRLLGVVLFELVESRWLLLVFPNVFEYFFILIEVFRWRWDPRRLSRATLVGLAAGLWIFVKLPQEYWIHIAKLDVTDVVKRDVLGYSLATPWADILAANVAALVLIGVVLALLLVGTGRWLARRLPPPDWAPTLAPDAHLDPPRPEQLTAAARILARRLVDWELLEKTALIAQLVIVFAQILPGIRSTNLELALAIAVVVVVNTWLTEYLIRRGVTWSTALRRGITMLVMNLPVFFLLSLLRYGQLTPAALVNILVFMLLLSLIVTLYDRYRPIYLVRFGHYPGSLAANN